MAAPSWRRISNKLPVGLIFLDEKLDIAFVNERFSQIVGLSAKKIIGKNYREMIFRDPMHPENQLDFRQCFDNEASITYQKNVLLECQGEQKAVHVSVKLLFEDYHAVLAVSDLSQTISCEALKEQARQSQLSSMPIRGLIGKHPKMLELSRHIQLAAESDASVLVLGESGTGKERIADAIQRASSRRDGPLIKVHVSALSESLLESELFGHVKGAFTGAIKDKIGKFEAANGGTLFLDEIGEIPPLIQVKLLRALQERIIEPVGSNESRKVDIRLITATHRQLRKQVENGEFREDLYYRLNVFPITPPPLRERLSDVPLLVHHFRERLNHRTGKQIEEVEPEAMRLLMDYHWPGNVRELENAMEYAFVLTQGTRIEKDNLPKELREEGITSLATTENPALSNASFAGQTTHSPAKAPDFSRFRNNRAPVSREELIEMLDYFGGNRSETAKTLGISTVALWKKMKKFELI